MHVPVVVIHWSSIHIRVCKIYMGAEMAWQKQFTQVTATFWSHTGVSMGQ